MPEGLAEAPSTGAFDLNAAVDTTFDSMGSDPAAEPAAAEPAAFEPEETPAPEAEAEPATPEATEPEPTAVEAEAAQPEAVEEDLPEGVIKKDFRGKPEYHLTPPRYEQFHGAYRTLREAETLVGEPVTADLLKDLTAARELRDFMRLDILSGEPERQTRFLDYIARISENAINSGDVSHDPLMTLAAQMPQFLAQRHPDANDALSRHYFTEALGGLFERAVQAKDQDLLNSVQWIQNKLFGKYSKPEELTQPDPLANREARLMRREQELLTQSQREAGERWSSTISESTRQNLRAESEEISAILKPIEPAYKQFPEVFQGYQDRLKGIVRETLKNDQAWLQRRNSLVEQARTTRSEERRRQLLEDIGNRTRTRIQQILDPSVNPKIKTILDQGAAAVKAQAAQKTARLEANAARREPGGGGTASQRSVLPAPQPKGQRWGIHNFYDEVEAALR